MIDVITMPSLVGSVGGVQAATAYLDIPSLTGNNPFVYEDRWCSQCASDVKLERLVQKRQGLVHSNLQMRPRQCALLVRRRRETSFGTGSRPLTARLVGASLRQYQVFEDQRETGFDVPFIRGACELFKVRFNFLSYENKPLVDPVSIWNDIVLRCAQMQLSREELIEALRSLGFSYTYESLKVAVFSGKARSEALRGALALLLHTRIWPDNVQGQQITTIDTLIQVVRRLRQEWQMSAAEMAEIFYQEKFTGKEIGNIECGYYKIDHPCVRQLAEGLELSLSKIYTSPDVLPVIEKKQWYDDALIKLITDRCQMLRISAWQLADRIGVSGDPLNKILTGRTTLDGRKFWHSYRNDLELCAAYLKIPLHSIAQLPAEIITVTKQPQDTAEDYATKVLTAVMEMVVKRRKGLAYTINETAILYKEKYGIGIDAASITALEQGTFFVRNAVNKIERLALLFAIDYDPFAFLEPLALDNTIDKAVLATIMRERKKTCPVSSRRLAQIMGVNHRELAGMFTGHYSRRHVKVQDLLICLKIKLLSVTLPPQVDRIQAGETSLDYLQRAWQRLEVFAKSEALTVSEWLVQAGISERDQRCLLRGDFSVTHPLVLVLAHMSKLWLPDQMQALLESHYGDQKKVETFIGTPLPSDGYWITQLPQGLESNEIWLHRRTELLNAQLVGSTLSDDDLTFLRQSGGTVDELRTIPRERIYYLLSLGDATSTAIWMQKKHQRLWPFGQNLIIELTGDLFRDYDRWMKSVYGISTINFLGDSMPYTDPLPKSMPAIRKAPIWRSHVALKQILASYYKTSISNRKADRRKKDRVQRERKTKRSG